MIEVLLGVGRMSDVALGQLQAKLLKADEVWRKKRKKAAGYVVIKGAGRRSGKVRIRPMPGRRDGVALAEADEALRRISRDLEAVRREQDRRLAGEAARA